MVSTTELHATLERALSQYFGASRRISKLERRPSDYRTSFALEELDVHLDDDTILRLMFKDLSWHMLLENGRRAKPDFLYDPQREIRTYGVILEPHSLGTAICYGTIVEERAGRYWLFLEKVPGLELYQIGEFTTWQQVARWLAAMHARFARTVDLFAPEAHLLNYTKDFYWTWMRRAEAFLGQSEAAQPRGVWHRIEWLAERYHRVVERLLALPATFIHGEFYASNVLVQETVGALRVCPVDWEMAAVGPGLIDLAALTAGNWTTEEKTALALAYYDALPANDGWPPGPEAFLNALQYCQLYKAVQWLGWSPQWSPPPEHQQDWLGEALRLAEHLDL